MESSIVLGIDYKTISITIYLATIPTILLSGQHKVILIYEITTRVIWWIYVYNLYLAKIILSQYFKDF